MFHWRLKIAFYALDRLFQFHSWLLHAKQSKENETKNNPSKNKTIDLCIKNKFFVCFFYLLWFCTEFWEINHSQAIINSVLCIVISKTKFNSLLVDVLIQVIWLFVLILPTSLTQLNIYTLIGYQHHFCLHFFVLNMECFVYW